MIRDNIQYYNNQCKSENILFKFSFIIATLYFIWSQTPYIFRNTSILIGGMLMIAWLIVATMFIYTKKSIYEIKVSWIIIIVMYWLGIVSIYIMRQLPNFAFGNLMYIIMYYFPIFMLLFYFEYASNTRKRKIINITMLIMLINNLSNLTILSDNPYASKEVTGSYGNYIEFSKTNIISDIYILGIVITIFISLIILKFSNKNKIKFLSLIYIPISVLLVIKSTFFIATITMILCFISLIILKNNKKKPLILKLLAVLIFTIILWIIREPILNQFKLFISSITDNYLIIERVNITCDLIINFNITGTLLARFNDTMISINTFINNPIFGKGYIISNNILESGIGMHSHIFDDLARFGVVAFSIEMSIYVLMIKFISNKDINLNIKNVYYACYIGFIFYSFLNPVVYPQTGIILFFLLPLTISYYGNLDRRR